MASSEPGGLSPLEEDWSRALAVVAHPDDLEYGAAAAIARWTGQGKAITYCLATRGEAGIDTMLPSEAGPLRSAEQTEAARLVGVATVEFLDHPDGVLEYGLPLRRDIARAIRCHRPEVVITQNFRETFGPGALNQADHIATGRAVLDAVRDAGNRWVFTELLTEEGLEPWNGVRQVWAAGSPEAAHGADITGTFETGVASLAAHAAYLAALPRTAMSDPEEFLESIARPAGTRLGTRYAATFELIPMR
jgi:LmbE family N-acetylglucosaminyl deacetylase